MALQEASTAAVGDAGEAGFNDMALPVGTVLKLSQESATGMAHFPVRYIGAIAGVSFLTTLPKRDDGVIWMRAGGRVTFRVLAGTNIYAFATTVLRAHTRPSPYAHFALPAAVRYKPVRRDLRVATRLAVEVETGDGIRTRATMRDLSLGGAILEADGLPAILGDALRIELPLTLPELSRTLVLPAVVRNCSGHAESAGQGRFRYGVEFDPVPEQDGVLLHYFIDHLVAEPHAAT
jgi:c-di-GMP-binding flagellar brake protein YcgR